MSDMPILKYKFKRDEVIRILIATRCKIAQKVHDSIQFNRFYDNVRNTVLNDINNDDKFVLSLFPPRSQWCHLGSKNGRQKYDNIYRNKISLYYTYIKAKRSNSTEQWYVKLCNYADLIIQHVLSFNNVLSFKVFPLEKERDGINIICRPICQFSLESKIIISLINKRLTDLFDDQFLDCSYAFRKPTNLRNGMMHLYAVKCLQQYRLKHLGTTLYVAECDMQKFYDTIDHNIIKRRFVLLMLKKIFKLPISYTIRLCYWFFKYVDCYSFYSDVFFKQKEFGFYNKIKKTDSEQCQIKWVDGLDCKKNKNSLGIPQGGALSTLIANIVLHSIDKKIDKCFRHMDYSYMRYCDDMIVVSPSQNTTQNIFNLYKKEIEKSQLIMHKENNNKPVHARDIWTCKTRSPYKWGEDGIDVFPWVTFVGFDCNWNGNLRIRKKSIKKNKKKFIK